MLARLDAERDELDAAAEAAEESDCGRQGAPRATPRAVSPNASRRWPTAQTALADLNARRGALEAALAAKTSACARFESELANVTRELDALRALAGSDDEFIARGRTARAARRRSSTRPRKPRWRPKKRTRRRANARPRTRAPHTEAERKAQRLETEVRTLSKLLATAESDLWPPVVEEITVEKGYEAALGAALGDDLDASDEHVRAGPLGLAATSRQRPRAAARRRSRWRTWSKAPPALARRLAQIGIVVRGDGAQLAEDC